MSAAPDLSKDWRSEHTSLVVTGVTGVSYFAGYLSVSVFADRLGVAVKDLGLDLRDYVLLATTALIAVTVAAVVLFTLVRLIGLGEGSARLNPGVVGGLFLRIPIVGAYLGVACGSMGFVFALAMVAIFTTGGDVVLGTYIAIALFFVGLLLHGARGRRTLAGVALLTLVTVVALCSASANWADDLRVDLVGSRQWRSSLPLSLVLNPVRGVATVGDKSACVLRVSGNVLLGTNGAVVMKELDRFETAKCKVAPRPFDPRD